MVEPKDEPRVTEPYSEQKGAKPGGPPFAEQPAAAAPIPSV